MAGLIIHAGFPKCGSTTIFSALQDNLDVLRGQGVKVFNRNLELPVEPDKLQPPLWQIDEAGKNPEKAAILRNKIIAQLKKSSPHTRLILSSENLASIEIAKRIFSGIEDFCDVHLIFYIRPQIDWIPSAWKQWDMREGWSLANSVDRHLRVGFPAYRPIIDTWRQVVPSAKIDVRMLARSELVGGDPVPDFFDVIGVNGARDSKSVQANPSVDYALLHLMMKNHTLFFNNRHDSAFMHRLVACLPDQYLKTNCMMLNRASVDAIYERFQADNLYIAGQYMQVADPESYVQKHFKKASKSESYEDMKDDEIMDRAVSIIESVFDVRTSMNRLGYDLLDAVNSHEAQA